MTSNELLNLVKDKISEEIKFLRLNSFSDDEKIKRIKGDKIEKLYNTGRMSALEELSLFIESLEKELDDTQHSKTIMSKSDAINKLTKEVEPVKYRNQEVVLLSKAIEMIKCCEEEYWHRGKPTNAGLYEITKHVGIGEYEYKGIYRYDTRHMFFIQDGAMEIINYDNIVWHHVPKYIDC